MQPTLVKLIVYNGQEYQQACQLRYQLFFAKHNLPWKVVDQTSKADNFYAAIVIAGQVVAYGELVPQGTMVYKICQMVVHPSYQRQNLGRQILEFLIDLAQEQGAIALTLNSRIAAIGFYQKLGFQTFGQEFASSTTGIMHIGMSLKLMNSKLENSKLENLKLENLKS